MNRAKSRQNTDVCADCGAPDPSWASVNRGILLCVECCCIHRNLGRHVSQVKSLQHNSWSGHLLTMVQTLYNSGVNNIWEHLLLENGSKLNKKKPNPKDSLDVKSEFIKEKHKHCAFVFRPNNEDGLLCVENELGKQLHASVRTNNLETSFRFLIQGADPNFFHDEKGTTPLHVAAKKNQMLQVELLVVYGADPTYPDLHGKTPIDYARQKGNKELTNRLTELQYEVTDKFSNYLCQRKPDHQSSVHFLVPPSGPQSEKNINNKLKKLPNRLFEELAMDVYDEIDRREIEAIWLSSSDSVKLSALPFLPVDPTLSTTRNQSRQKLGKFSSPELKALVYDILIDTQRRQIASERGVSLPMLREVSQMQDDDPLYDSVASDDDYAVVADTPEENGEQLDNRPNTIKKDNNDNTCCAPSTVDVVEITKKLELSDTTISSLKQEVVVLKALVEKLNSENSLLKSRLSHAETGSMQSFVEGDSGCSSLDGLLTDPKVSNGQLTSPIDLKNSRKATRPLSMFETREGLKTPNWQDFKNQLKQNDQSRTTTSLYNNPTQSQAIFQCTDQITKAIQQLMQSIIDSNGRELCLTHSDKIKAAVIALSGNVPIENRTETTRHLLENVFQLQKACLSLMNAHRAGDQQQVNILYQTVREWAYEIAKNTKQIVTKYTV